MADNETPVTSRLLMDRAEPLGNSNGIDDRRALHVKIKNKTDEPINVNAAVTVIGDAPQAQSSIYSEISAVPSSALTPIVSYTIPPGQTFYMQRIEASGQNIATYSVSIDAIVISKRRTYFGGDLNTDFEFTDGLNTGFQVLTGSIVTLQVIHERPYVADFNGRIQGRLTTP